MSHFYGTLEGQAGKATRRGSKNSGLVTHAASWAGAVKVELSINSRGEDWADVYLVPWRGAGVMRKIWSGKVDGKDWKGEAA